VRGSLTERGIRVNEIQANIIIAVCGCIGSIIGSFGGFRLISYRVEQLEKKVDKHNNFAERLPVVEEQIKVINHRLEDIEEYEKNK
jgi:hypothetical protein